MSAELLDAEDMRERRDGGKAVTPYRHYCRLCGAPFDTADGYATCQRCNRGMVQ